MNSWLFTLWIAVVIQRILELRLAARNDDWIQRQGGFEVGQSHYPYLVGLHILFFVGIGLESYFFRAIPPKWWLVPFIFFLFAQLLRWYAIHSLGPYWSTRVWVISEHAKIKRGPYRWIRHPNYVAVGVELFCLPLVFGAYITSVLITILNLALLLLVRLPVEERALSMRK
ncbi:15-methylpalmitoyl-4-hydroxy-2-pyrone 4-O-methyltransferase [Seinonella peptonophila]|uniref:15-methylpalmitoyl-4-hydroxy-2-pyrone 4-O-methyltransferase n=1 Tax=Seinonella peptonophila TaxID=112248 RepID=A0A1M4WLW4_9BACL|nr:isoprenylcysteine carboxylmethyltransferase family protein [Seinonella peptonophila]SHE81952.1 15-methylpalmitoyl-4-hydroxy-2-pyrone 4-O-methyltransferase [Seinonella peptonophila]